MRLFGFRSLVTRPPDGRDGCAQNVWVLTLRRGWLPWVSQGFWSGDCWYSIPPNKGKVVAWRPFGRERQRRCEEAAAAHYKEMDDRFGHLTP